MKNLCIALLAFGLGTHSFSAETRPTPSSASQSSELPRFDLDFGGGSPSSLIGELNVALSGRLNAVIPKDAESVEIPPLRLRGVNVAQVFTAIEEASHRGIPYEVTSGITSDGHRQILTQVSVYSYGFRTQGVPTENSVWYFHLENTGQLMARKTCKYYQLASYLEEFKVEDITTAIKTGWEMLGIKGEEAPQLKFHQDTKLLVAVGDPVRLAVIDDVLAELLKANKATSKTGTVTPVKK